MANLVISKFVIDADGLSVGQPADAKLTVKNTGSAAAASSTVQVTYIDDKGASGTGPQIDVDEIEAGGSAQVTVPLSVDHAGTFTFTAEADWFDDAVESDEGDNSAELTAVAIALPNLAFAANGFSFKLNPNPGFGYDVYLTIENTGTAGVVDPFQVSFTYYVGAADSGTLKPYACCISRHEDIIDAGGTSGQLSQGGYSFTPGDYIIYAFLDQDRVIDETTEDDNEARFDLHVP